MKDETKIWLIYANENLDSSQILLESHLYNPCLQNIQQSVEKSIKAILIEKSIKLKRTHDILELKYLLQSKDIQIDITDDDCDFLNTIYMPSKYPIGSVLPEYDPDDKICNQGILIAKKVINSVKQYLAGNC